MHEYFYYNACAQFCDGSYKKLSELKSGHATWRDVYTKNARFLPDPETSWNIVVEHNLSLVLFEEEGFPLLLKQIPSPPFGLYYRGSLASLDAPCVAIVGTRKASAQAQEFTKKISGELCAAGITIISGLARGVDSMAHLGAIARSGKTVAVLAQGLSHIYPRQNSDLAEKIIATGGAVVSEYPPLLKARLYTFLERNRIVSGLSRAVVVVEAPARSGTLSTAKHALEHNREVLVVPGPVSSLNYSGSHALIRAGAELITSSAEILETLGMKQKQETLFQTFEHLNADQQKIVAILEKCVEPIHLDMIGAETKLDSPTLNSELSDLIINGYIKEDRGLYFLA